MYKEVNILGETLNFLDIKEVADMLDKHTRTIRRWVQNGDLTAYKIGGKYHFKQKDLEKFIEDSKL